MKYIIGLYAVGWLIISFGGDFYLRFLSLDIYEVLHGQVWRLFTFIILPPQQTNLFLVFFALYLYYILGTDLERVWGAFRFNLYFFMGVLFHILAGFIIYFIFGYSYPLSTYYLNLSLFFASACVYPDMELLFFFVLPIKMKWLALLDAVFFTATIFFGFFFDYFPVSVQANLLPGLIKMGIIPIPAAAIAALVSIMNFGIFFLMTRNYKRITPKEIHRKKAYKKQVQRNNENVVHKCDVCGRTSDEFPDLVFRYCSKCSGSHEYCQEHLFTHEHIK